jgi:hypothetical protein
VELHANFTAVWQAYGWLPEAYSIDTARINPEDPGYNLRPEHVESTYLLHAATGNPVYLKTARSLLHVRPAGGAACCCCCCVGMCSGCACGGVHVQTTKGAECGCMLYTHGV